jgi:hypothetical protein
MKKLIAAAVTAAFVAPVYAADITLSGSQEFNWQDNNGASSSEVDGTVKVSASSELPNGMSVSATIALDEAGAADGGSNLKFGGDFGSIALGDVSGAIDSIDDVTDPSFEAGHGTDGTDANALWTLPSMVPGLSVYVSASAQSQDVLVKTQKLKLQAWRSSTQPARLQLVTVRRTTTMAQATRLLMVPSLQTGLQ